MTIREITKYYDLWGSDALVFEYIATLYYYGHSWTGTMEKLGFESRCGSKQTTKRAILHLIQVGLLIQNNNTIEIASQELKDLIGTKTAQNGTFSYQNETQQFQNGTQQFQNGTNSQKESNQRKIIKDNIKECESINNSNNTFSPSPKSLINLNSFNPPTWDEWQEYALFKRIDYCVYAKAYSYFCSRGWQKVTNWKAALVYWDLDNKYPKKACQTNY